MDMHEYFVIPPILGLGGLAVAFIIYHIMSRHNHGDGKVRKIGDQIHLGAMVFMAREYKMLSLFALVLLVAIFVSPLGQNTAIAFKNVGYLITQITQKSVKSPKGIVADIFPCTGVRIWFQPFVQSN